MWNSKILKIQKKNSKTNPEFQNFKSHLPHINRFKCTWCVKKSCSLLYKKTEKCKNKIKQVMI